MSGVAADWLDLARTCAAAGRPCALVTVAGVRGSAPREAGARMLVTAEGIAGTIGGGQLELQAIAEARRRLADPVPEPQPLHFALGPELGQCCGGSVDLAIEVLADGNPAILARWADWHDRALPSQHLYLFGAGHVGTAVAGIVAALPYRLHWIDGRPETAGAAAAIGQPLTVAREPALEVDSAADGAFYVVMTHSHALDLEICERVLRRGDFAFLGLIGSATKRARFVKRLGGRGIPEPLLQRLVCPIGIGGIRSKLPAAIAVGLAAQLLQASEMNAARRLKIA
jgi:xanthine dehydrogenase accessory factor